MRTESRRTRIVVCALLLLSSFLVLTFQISVSSTNSVHLVQYTTTWFVAVTTTTTQPMTVGQTIVYYNNTTVTVTSSAIILSTETETFPYVCVIVPGLVSIPQEMIPMMFLGVVVIVLSLFGSALTLRLRLSKALDALDSQRQFMHEDHASRPTASPLESVPAAQRQDLRYVEYLAKLEDLRTRGVVSQETYLKLKNEFFKKLGAEG